MEEWTSFHAMVEARRPVTRLVDIMSEREARDIGAFVTQETWRQGDGPFDVGHMLSAWCDAIARKDVGEELSLRAIVTWGKLIDPAANAGSATFRTGPIRIGYDIKTAEGIEQRMELWLAAVLDGSFEADDDITANDYAYKAFEDIHPFNDGNGRTGKLIYNWLNDSLRKPRFPHTFWPGIRNP